MSVSGLNKDQRTTARLLAVNAAMLGLQNAATVHYTQGPERWEGIDRHLVAARGEFPKHADCSAFVTWCLWNALALPFGVKDIVNGLRWGAGYTGTQATHGKEVEHVHNIRRGDLVLYGPPPTFAHVAMIVGRKDGKPLVVSHGSEPGPYLLPFDYRPVSQIRRYI